MLGRLDGALSIGECHQLWVGGLVENRLCGCSLPFSACPFWREVGEVAFGGWHKLDLERVIHLRLRLDRPWMVPLLLAPIFSPLRRDVEEYADLLRSLYLAIGRVSHATVVIDSSKIASHPLLVRRTGADVRLLHLVRDSRGVLYSWQKGVGRRDIANPDSDRLMLRYGVGAGSVRYLAYNLLAQLVGLTALPYRRTRYEDLVQNPEMVLDGVAAFAGARVPDDVRQGLADHRLLPGVDHTIDGNPIRLNLGEIAIRLDDEWQRRLGSRSRNVTTVLTLPLLAAYGYLPRRTRPGGDLSPEPTSAAPQPLGSGERR